MSVYLNNYKSSPPSKPLTSEDLNEHTHPSKYDYNFSGGRVRELRNAEGLLIPLNPSQHLEKFWELYQKYPEVSQFRTNQIKTKYDLMYYFEVVARREPGRLNFAVFHMDLEKQAAHFEPPLDCLAGHVTILEFDPDRLQCELGITIFPPWQGKITAYNAISLLQTWVFCTLGCVNIKAYGNNTNSKVVGLGSKLGFHKEIIRRSDAAHIPTWAKAEVEAKLKTDPTLDPRTFVKASDNAYASIHWEAWEKKHLDRLMHTCINITCPEVYKNLYKPPVPTSPLPFEMLHSQTALEKYDINFAGAGEIKEFQSSKALLVPFIPSVHVKTLHDTLTEYPESFQHYVTTTANIVDSQDNLLRYFESVRRDEKQTAWVVYDIEDKDKGLRSPRRMIGFVSLKECGGNAGGAKMGPFIIIPHYMNSAVVSHAVALLLKYLFATPAKGLGLFRLEWSLNVANNNMINLARSLNFQEEGSTSFVYSPGYKVDPDQVKFPLFDRRGKPDPRRELVVHHRLITSVTFDDWVNGGTEKMVDSVLES